MTQKKRKSGDARMMLCGLKPIVLGLTQEQHALLRRTAQAEGLPMTQSLLKHWQNDVKKSAKAH